MKAKILNKILLSLCLMFVLGRAMTHAEDDSPTSPQEIAETPIPTATPNATEVFTTAHDGTCLQWDVYLPETISATLRPVVLVVHIGAFRAGSRKDSGAVKVATTLRDAGFIALHSGIATGAEHIIIPERKTDVVEMIKSLQEKEKSTVIQNIKSFNSCAHITYLLYFFR